MSDALTESTFESLGDGGIIATVVPWDSVSLPPLGWKLPEIDEPGPCDAYSEACVSTLVVTSADREADLLLSEAKFHALRVNAMPLIADRYPEKTQVCRISSN